MKEIVHGWNGHYRDETWLAVTIITADNTVVDPGGSLTLQAVQIY